jgi:lipopolysaccharide export system protein LptC
LTLGSIAAGSWLASEKPVPIPPAPQAAESALGYYLKDAVFRGLDTEGHIVYRLAAARIDQARDSDILELAAVEITYRDEQDVPWIIRASRARSTADRSVIELEGDVTIESSGPGEFTRIESSDLRLEPNNYFASTSGPVRFAYGNNRIYAVGLKAYLQDERIDLESEVHAEAL